MIKKTIKAAIFLLFFSLIPNAFSHEDKEVTTFNPNFAHTVYFWLKKPESTTDRLQFETSLKKFLKNSAFAQTNFIGTPPKAERTVVDGTFTYSLIVTFSSAEDQQNYQNEIAHTVFLEEASDLWNKVVVYNSIPVK